GAINHRHWSRVAGRFHSTRATNEKFYRSESSSYENHQRSFSCEYLDGRITIIFDPVILFPFPGN
ncbi:MAG TPA: hypothetical protein VF857_07030, partial [Spirochaetota bacterium]